MSITEIVRLSCLFPRSNSVPVCNPLWLYSCIFRTADWLGIALPVWRLTTGWTFRGSNPSGGKIFASIQVGSGVHPASYTMSSGPVSHG